MKITLCGSARFEAYYHEANKRLGLAGHICYSLMTFPSIEGSKSWYTDAQKWTLDLAHLAKIEESDAVVMLNIAGYLGESSLRELEWARMRQKGVYWVEDFPNFVPGRNGFWARNLIWPESTRGPWTELLDAVRARAP